MLQRCMTEHTEWLFHRAPPAPQLSQQIPTDGRLACNKPAVKRDGERTAAAQLVHMVLRCRQVAILWQFRKQATGVANYGCVPVGTSVANNCGVPVSTSSNAHSTHLHLSHPPSLQPFVPQPLLQHLFPFYLQSIYDVGLLPLQLGRLCF